MLDQGIISSLELTQEFLNRSKKINPKINSVISHTEEYAIKSAKEADEAIKDKKSKLLTGIPVMIKDNISTKNIETTAASKILNGYIPPYDATVIKNLFTAIEKSFLLKNYNLYIYLNIFSNIYY